jgi:Helix-turn-helix domain
VAEIPTCDGHLIHHGTGTGNLVMQRKIIKGTRLTGAAREILLGDLKYKYLTLNMHIRALVVDSGRSYGTIHSMLSDEGVLRSKGGKPRK